MKIAGISSKKLPDASEAANIKNNNLYNDKELFGDGDLNWYDYGFRNYDPQIGRFVQLDPLTDDYPELTNYQYASCEPIGNVDVDGLERAGVLGSSAGSAISAGAGDYNVAVKFGTQVASTSSNIGARLAITGASTAAKVGTSVKNQATGMRL